MSILIKNGMLVSSYTITKGDLLIENGIIKEIAQNIEPKPGLRIYDAKGCYVCPGGIDPHVHIQLNSNGILTADDWRSGTIAAACGGTTTIVEFIPVAKSDDPNDCLYDWLKTGKENSFIDFSLHMSAVSWDEKSKIAMENAIKEGINSVKIYMAYNGVLRFDHDEDLMDFLVFCRDHGILPMVHCEDGDMVEYLRKYYAERRMTTPEYHQLSRTYDVESAAVKRITTMANNLNSPLYVVHNTCKDSIDCIKNSERQSLYAEVTINHLTLNSDEYKKPVEEAVQYVLSPPLRPEIERQKLWKEIQAGNVSTISTDHCPFYKKDKLRGKDDFRKIPNGSPAIEERMTLFWHYGVGGNMISPIEFVNLTSTNSAKIFGMYPQKGELQVGSDGDVIIIDPKAKRTITVKDQKGKVDYNNWEGLECTGIPIVTIQRGQVIFECNVKDNIADYGNGTISEDHKGKFIYRESYVPYVYSRLCK